MSTRQYEKAMKLIERNKVTPEPNCEGFWDVETLYPDENGEYRHFGINVTKKGTWNCTCIGKAAYAKSCCHILACKIIEGEA